MFEQPWHRWAVWGMRAALVVALAVTIVFPTWEQFEGKGMAFRAPFFALSMVATPLIWKLRGSHRPYPWAVDVLVVAPFLVDTLGNVFGFYNNYDATDDVLHVVNWVLLIGGVTLAVARTGIGRLNAWALGYGIGGLAIIWWEAMEWLVQELGTAGLQLTYDDTIGDLVLSSTGGAIGALLAVLAIRPGRPTEPTGPAAPPSGTGQPADQVPARRASTGSIDAARQAG